MYENITTTTGNGSMCIVALLPVVSLLTIDEKRVAIFDFVDSISNAIESDAFSVASYIVLR